MMLSLVAMFGLVLTSCDDDDDNGVAKAVLASVSVLNYDAQQTPGQIITVYSDATWTCEHPDWVIVEPETGTGITEVRISVLDNMRDGAEDQPRIADVVFKGIKKSSEAHVTVRQGGDLFRDVAPSTIAEAEKLDNEKAAIFNNVTVATVYEGKFIVTDGTRNALVQSGETVAPGQVINLFAQKQTDAQKLPIFIADHFTAGSAAAATVPAAVDITDKIDSWTGDARTLVTVTGKLNGKNIVVGESTNMGVAVDVPAEIEIGKLGGHSVTVAGYYGGTAAPAVNLSLASLEDHGVVEVIYWAEDFEWLADWFATEGQTVETDNPSATADNLVSSKVTFDGKTAYQKLLDKGYEFLATHAASKSARDPEKQIYGQKNYLKFGLTGYYSGIVLLVNEEIPAEETVELHFDWCSMRQGSGKWDPTEIVVIIDDVQYPVPALGWADNHVYEWVPFSVELPAGTVKKGTKITIRNADSQWPADGAALRWFLDNVKIIQK